MKPVTAIAVSGGIDSLTAAHLLKEQGHEVIGINFINGYETLPSLPNSDAAAVSSSGPPDVSTCMDEALRKMSPIADQLGIRIEIIDLSVEFKARIVDYFVRSYMAGQTPNPCLVCNPVIKFGTVLAHAGRLGASHLATGHYARISQNRSGRFHLLKGVDPIKDQSYFLAFLTQKQLAHALFPLGDMIKAAVKKLASGKGLQPATGGESQDICFIKGDAYGQFLMRHQGFIPKPGLIEDVNGNVLGEHKGLHLFTIGQRRGINRPASEPYYVVHMDTKKNRLVVGFKKDLESSSCRVGKINWITQAPTSPIQVFTRVRYRHQAALSKLFPESADTAVVQFENPQAAVTPGQGAVFYRDDEILGGGWIEQAHIYHHHAGV